MSLMVYIFIYIYIYCLFRTVTVFLLNERNFDIAAAAMIADDAEESEFVTLVTENTKVAGAWRRSKTP